MSCARFDGLGALLALLVLGSTACAQLKVVNEPLAQLDPGRGYRPSVAEQHRDAGRIFLTLAFSGGGTRAAAFAYGVLEELRESLVEIDGRSTPLLAEVDTLTGVSGGSFPAAYYALYEDRIFEEFEPRFLDKNIQGALFLRALIPWNFLRLLTPSLDRSDIASRYYHEHVFDEATFARFADVKGPRVYINATDLSIGHRFTFTQGQFDVICSDLDALPVSYAVAASSAVPGLLTPITLQNFAGSCGFEVPPFLLEAMDDRYSDPRRYRAARSFLDYQDQERRYIHLIDGGISDNLGLRAPLEAMAAAGGAEKLSEVFGVGEPDHLVVISVNAETDPNLSIDFSAAAPSLMAMMSAVSGAQIRRYNFETVLLAQDAIRQAATDLSRPGHQVQGHFIDVNFENFLEEEDRRYFKGIPTSFKLSEEEVDRLREAGRKLLRDSPDFQALLKELR